MSAADQARPIEAVSGDALLADHGFHDVAVDVTTDAIAIRVTAAPR